MTKKNTTHGGTGSPTYASWQSMRRRCLDPTDPHWPNYGGRGIKIHPQWDDFAVFLADAGERPSAVHSLDRYPDNDGDYEPGNVRWATPKEQSRNKRTNVRIEYQGETLTIAEWAERAGVPYRKLYQRLWEGWSLERAMQTPIGGACHAR